MTLGRPRDEAVTTACGLVLGYAVDALVGDPRWGHPVAAFGRVAGRLEQRLYRPDRAAGAAYTGLLVGGAALLGGFGERVAPRGLPRMLVTAAGIWAVLGGRSLGREAATVADQLERGDLAAARVQVTHLVGRDTSRLDVDEVARATVESVAENTADAVVAPLLWGAVLGVPGLLAYRAANTLDAMVGHRSERYARFGWASARLDDLLNLAPARVSAVLTALAAPLVGGSPRDALLVALRDAARHPSPNAGVVEAAFAGALGVRLGGVNVYAGHVEDRGTLGHGRPVEVRDVARAVRLSRLTSALTLALAVGVALRPRGPRGPRRDLDTRRPSRSWLSVAAGRRGDRVSRNRRGPR